MLVRNYLLDLLGLDLTGGITKGGEIITERLGIILKNNQYNVKINGLHIKNIKDVEFIFSNYLDLEIPSNSLIYCDPPYNTNATKGKYKDDFDHETFWNWCREKKQQGHVVFVSEYNAPEDFKCVWEMEVKQKMNNTKNTTYQVEKLFTL